MTQAGPSTSQTPGNQTELPIPPEGKIFSLSRLSIVFGIVTVGWSQVFFNMILWNRDVFPAEGLFHLWMLVWVEVIPFLLVFAVDAVLARRMPRLFRLWRTLLYTLVIISFQRQIGMLVFNLSFTGHVGLLVGFWMVGLTVVIFLCYRFWKLLGRYFAWFSILAAILIVSFVYKIGLLGPAWTGVPHHEVTTAPEDDGPPVFLIVFDALSLHDLFKDGEIDRKRFPNFAALADDSAFFRNANTNFGSTKESISILLTGKLNPTEEDVVIGWLPAGYRAELFLGYSLLENHLLGFHGNTGRIAFRGNSYQLSHRPLNSAQFLWQHLAQSTFIPNRIRHFLPGWGGHGGWKHLGFKEQFGDFLSSVRADRAQGRFFYWHCSLPHLPFVLTRDGTLHKRKPVGSGVGYQNKAIYENYLEQIELTDRMLGRFLDKLREEGLYEKALIFVTSDHGIVPRFHQEDKGMEPPGFPEVRGNRTPFIPFIAKGPGIMPGPRDTDYQHVDFPSTVLQMLGRPPSPGLEGISAFEPDRPVRNKVFRAHIAADGEIIEGTYIYDPDDRVWRRR